MTALDTQALRTALGCYATGVAIVSTHTPGRGLVGVTVNSFTSVSLDPPLILFSLSRHANVLNSFQEANSFVINILSLRQEELSNMFARPSTASWDKSTHVINPQGCALLTDSLSQLECTKRAELDGGDHVIFVGVVEQLHLPKQEADPLLFYRGGYGTYQRTLPRRRSLTEQPFTDSSVSGWG